MPVGQQNVGCDVGSGASGMGASSVGVSEDTSVSGALNSSSGASAKVVASLGLAATTAPAAPVTAATVPVAAVTISAVGRRPVRLPEAPSPLASFFLLLEGNHEDFFFLGWLEEGADTAGCGIEGGTSEVEGCLSAGRIVSTTGVRMTGFVTSGTVCNGALAAGTDVEVLLTAGTSSPGASG